MPTRIPVRISEHEFPSLNRARLHYLDILHKYQPGQTLNEADGKEVSGLAQTSAGPLPPACSAGYRVVQGSYGRTCFATVMNDREVRVVSIMRSVKSFVSPAKHSPPAHLELSDSALEASAVHPCTGSGAKVELTVEPVQALAPKQADELKPATQLPDASPPALGPSGSHAKGQKQGNPKKAEKTQIAHVVKQRIH
ncbi:hypothetical protein BSY15_4020 [Acidovorax sp. RAC01]|nr:hypothetical protein BSY15_4020 [Acidovorax sp. RAC01]